MKSVLALAAEPEFALGLRYGAASLLVALPLGLVWRRWRCEPAPAGGLLLVLGFGLALHEAFGFPVEVAVSLVLLAAVGACGKAARFPGWCSVVAAAPAGWLLVTHGGLVDVDWIRIAVGVAAVVGGIAVADFDRRWASTSAGPMLLGVSVVGVYYTVPDTEEALVLLGVTLPILLLTWPVPLLRLGSAGAMVATGALTWVVAKGGFGRQSSIVGGLACLGLLALEPLSKLIRQHGWVQLIPRYLWAAPTLATIHLAFVTMASRVAGLREPAPARPGRPLARGGVAEAVGIVAAEIAVGLLLAVVLHRSFASARSQAERGLK